MSDITVGEQRQLRGHWADRLAEIDADIAGVEAKRDSAKPSETGGRIAHAIAEALSQPQMRTAAGQHTPGTRFESWRWVRFAAEKDYTSVRLYYRHVNQAERWQSVAMQRDARLWRAEIPSEYAESPYPLQYYFEATEGRGSAALYPGFGEQLTGQPYFVVRRG